MNFSSKLLEEAVEAFATLPGIGKKTALRLVLYLLKQEPDKSTRFAEALVKARLEIKECEICFNFSDESICNICNDRSRMGHTICVVENVRDVMAIEETGQFNGLYHVLGGVISPIDGVGPQDLNIDSLFQRIQKEEVKEIIMAISPTIEGETTTFYISKNLGSAVNISQIARGVSFGGELEYADEITLGRSIMTRTPYNVLEE